MFKKVCIATATAGLLIAGSANAASLQDTVNKVFEGLSTVASATQNALTGNSADDLASAQTIADSAATNNDSIASIDVDGASGTIVLTTKAAAKTADAGLQPISGLVITLTPEFLDTDDAYSAYDIPGTFSSNTTWTCAITNGTSAVDLNNIVVNGKTVNLLKNVPGTTPMLKTLANSCGASTVATE